MTSTTTRATAARARRRRGFLLARVQAATDVTRHMRRVTLTAPEIAGFDGQCADQFVRLLLAPPGRREPMLPVTTDWWQELLGLPDPERPVLRNYTIRHLRRDLGELDIDFVLHGDPGPASSWAARAMPGDVVGVLEQDASFAAAPGTDWDLLAGDETALPAIGAILEGLPSGRRVEVFVEVPSAEDVQQLPTAATAHVTWLPRSGDLRPGSLVTRAVTAAELPTRQGAAWIAGEASMTTAIRRHLVNDRGFEKSAVEFCGYWRRDRPAYD